MHDSFYSEEGLDNREIMENNFKQAFKQIKAELNTWDPAHEAYDMCKTIPEVYKNNTQRLPDATGLPSFLHLLIEFTNKVDWNYEEGETGDPEYYKELMDEYKTEILDIYKVIQARRIAKAAETIEDPNYSNRNIVLINHFISRMMAKEHNDSYGRKVPVCAIKSTVTATETGRIVSKIEDTLAYPDIKSFLNNCFTLKALNTIKPSEINSRVFIEENNTNQYGRLYSSKPWMILRVCLDNVECRLSVRVNIVHIPELIVVHESLAYKAECSFW